MIYADIFFPCNKIKFALFKTEQISKLCLPTTIWTRKLFKESRDLVRHLFIVRLFLQSALLSYFSIKYVHKMSPSSKIISLSSSLKWKLAPSLEKNLSSWLWIWLSSWVDCPFFCWFSSSEFLLFTSCLPTFFWMNWQNWVLHVWNCFISYSNLESSFFL